MISVMDKPEEVANWIWDKGKSGTEHIKSYIFVRKEKYEI